MKNLEKGLIIFAFFCAMSSLIFSLMNNQPWIWQGVCMIWIFVAFMKNRLIERYETLIKNMSK